MIIITCVVYFFQPYRKRLVKIKLYRIIPNYVCFLQSCKLSLVNQNLMESHINSLIYNDQGMT